MKELHPCPHCRRPCYGRTCWACRDIGSQATDAELDALIAERLATMPKDDGAHGDDRRKGGNEERRRRDRRKKGSVVM